MPKIEIIVNEWWKSNFDACYIIIRLWDFSLDFTERVTFIKFFAQKKIIYLKHDFSAEHVDRR